MTGSPHEIINPSSLPKPAGYSHVVVANAGRTIYVAGQTAHGAFEDLASVDVADQFDVAAASVVKALEAAGARAEHLVSLQIFTTDLHEYMHASKAVGEAYRRHFGKHYVATALIEVKGLVGGAKVELVAVAVVPDE